jgi:hypothetical protein
MKEDFSHSPIFEATDAGGVFDAGVLEIEQLMPATVWKTLSLSHLSRCPICPVSHLSQLSQKHCAGFLQVSHGTGTGCPNCPKLGKGSLSRVISIT